MKINEKSIGRAIDILLSLYSIESNVFNNGIMMHTIKKSIEELKDIEGNLVCYGIEEIEKLIKAQKKEIKNREYDIKIYHEKMKNEEKAKNVAFAYYQIALSKDYITTHSIILDVLNEIGVTDESK